MTRSRLWQASMMLVNRSFAWMLPWLAALFVASAAPLDTPPELPREFRGAWVATVGNVDWPSRAGLPMNDQKAELRAIMDRAVQLKLNAIVFQVRPSCDAFYDSPHEPWSAYLTGTMGKSPEYDPLEFAVTEAHLRGLELHAWFNPFRALTTLDAPCSSGHVTKQHPEWVRRYNKQLWLDPGEPDVREHAIKVIVDVVKRYDIDGVHFDDYFYPYPSPSKEPFPDDATYRRYGGGKDRGDWRRDNTNKLVEKIYERVKATKRWVKVGISPFGIWRPGVPHSGIVGLDAYGDIYADSKKWLQEGWCDYFSPQLYWSIQQKKQSFPVLLEWWASENSKNRHLWPGIATERIGPARPAMEMINQIGITRQTKGSDGHIHWNMKALMRDKGGISGLLFSASYRHMALIPPSTWLGTSRLGKPSIERAGGRLTWRTPDGDTPSWWLLQARKGDQWAAQLVPGSRLGGKEPDAELISLRAMDRTGNLGDPTILKLK